MRLFLLLIANFGSVLSQGTSGPYYGLPMGSFYFSRDGTQGDVYAADPRTVIIVNFHQNSKPGCTTLMAGPVKKTDFSEHVAPRRRGVMLPVNLPKSVQLDSDLSKRKPEFRGKRQRRSLQDRLAAFNPNFLPFMPFQFAQLSLGEQASHSMGGGAFDGIELAIEEKTTSTSQAPPPTTTTPEETTPEPTTTTTTQPPITTTEATTHYQTTTPAPKRTEARTTKRATTTQPPLTTTQPPPTTTTQPPPTTTTRTLSTTTPEPIITGRLQPKNEDNDAFYVIPARELDDPRFALIKEQFPDNGDKFDYNPFGGDSAPAIDFSHDSPAETSTYEDESLDISYGSPELGVINVHHEPEIKIFRRPERLPVLEITETTPIVETTKTVPPTTTERIQTVRITERTESPPIGLEVRGSAGLVKSNDPVKDALLARKGLVFIDAPARSRNSNKQEDNESRDFGRGLIMHDDGEAVEASTVHYWGPLPRSPDLFIREDDDDKFAFFRRESAERYAAADAEHIEGVTAILGGTVTDTDDEEEEEPEAKIKLESRKLNRHLEIPKSSTSAPGDPLVFRFGGATTPVPPVTKGGLGLFQSTTPKPKGNRLWYVVDDPRKARKNNRGRGLNIQKPKPKSTPKPVADNLLSNKKDTVTNLPEGVDEKYVLPSINGETMIITLPSKYRLSDFEWFGIYDHCSQLKTAYVRTRDVQPPEEAVVEGIHGTEYGVSSGDIHIVNCNTLIIKNFKYQGAHVQDAFIYVGLGDYDQNDVLYQIPAQIVGAATDEPLQNTDGQDLMVRLPPGFKTFDINFLSVYSPRIQRSYGFATVPPVVVPPCEDLN